MKNSKLQNFAEEPNFSVNQHGRRKPNFINTVKFIKKVVLVELSFQRRLISFVDYFAFSKYSDKLLKQYLIGSLGATPRLQDYLPKKTD